MGNYLGPFLGYPKVDHVGGAFMYQVLVIAFFAGSAGAIFCKVVLVLDKWRRSLGSIWTQAAWAVGCAVAFAFCVHALGEQTLGSGKGELRHYLFDPNVDPGWRDVAARLLGPITTFSAGGAGGIFAPSLSSGAVIGGWIAQWFNPSRGEFNMLVLAGMVAFLTGVSRSPFTSAILVLEMTDRHSAIFQLMYAAMIANLIAYAVDQKSYYTRMKERLLKAIGEGVIVRGSDEGRGSDRPPGNRAG